MLNNPKLDVSINAYAKFGQNTSKFSHDTERKRNRRMDGQPENSISPHTSYEGEVYKKKILT